MKLHSQTQFNRLIEISLFISVVPAAVLSLLSSSQLLSSQAVGTGPHLISAADLLPCPIVLVPLTIAFALTMAAEGAERCREALTIGKCENENTHEAL